MACQGYIRVAAASPRLRVADCSYNVGRMLSLMKRAEEEQVSVLVFPELCVTGYTCADLFQQAALQKGAVRALEELAQTGAERFSGLAIVGLPLAVDDQLFNCAALLHRGGILGVVPKSFIPNYKEFYEGRWFAAAATARSSEVRILGSTVPFGTGQLFEAADVEGLIIGIEICEDLWVPVPPSSFQALRGATLIANPSASNEVIGKAAYRRQLVLNQSGRCLTAYIYAASGACESTTDVVFGGHSMIAENGIALAEAQRFERDDQLLAADVDLGRLRAERLRMNSFGTAQLSLGLERTFRHVLFTLERPAPPANLLRPVEAHPFVPRGKEQLRERCEEIFQTQVAGLAKRLEHLGRPPVVIGVSGGLDSTLALLVACRTFDTLGVCRQRIQAFTLPGFGTTSRTRSNARALMQQLGVTAREIDIRSLCLDEMRAIGHRPFGIALDGLNVDDLAERLQQLPDGSCQDVVFENVQARRRTNILMNAGFVIGTSDVSELALGWCTYNGDHMSMYNPNVSIPKTLVKFLIAWVAENELSGEARRILLDIVATEISPELLPAGKDGQAAHSTEAAIGPYELHDFFLFHFLRYGEEPDKILFLAKHARFERSYTEHELRRWLKVFIERFFGNQFKRSCLPDGPKVGSIALSPRGDWRMPSDAQAALWLEWVSKQSTEKTEAALASAGKERQ
jgi:NAD+ synthase (glutamine-hydrolysing)